MEPGVFAMRKPPSTCMKARQFPQSVPKPESLVTPHRLPNACTRNLGCSRAEALIRACYYSRVPEDGKFQILTLKTNQIAIVRIPAHRHIRRRRTGLGAIASVRPEPDIAAPIATRENIADRNVYTVTLGRTKPLKPPVLSSSQTSRDPLPYPNSSPSSANIRRLW
ncbi:MAG: hypothetical protein CM15mP6_3630 [Methanobacteriota archaeon]|nr:MAG: hypothetical protein CM15mP6_3630 [Euryarchaeota archaeon]